MLTDMKKLWRRWRSSRELSPENTSDHPGDEIYDISWPPPAPDVLLTTRSQYEQYLSKRPRFPRNRQDSPQDSLYRLYEHLVLNHRYGLRNEIEYFWNQSDWRVSDIPDPLNEDPGRYAILACISTLLLRAFNRNIGIGMRRDSPAVISDEEREELRGKEKLFEKLPPWTLKVKPAPETIHIPHEGDEIITTSEDERSDPAFCKMNILIWTPHVYFA